MRWSYPFAVILTVLMLVGLALPALAHSSPGYSHDSNPGASNPDWMAALPGSELLSQLSIPGTHDTMASVFGGDIALAQTMKLATQLNAEVRVLDIRLRHAGDRFYLYHGIADQGTEFGADVMKPVNTFLDQHPQETVLMRVKEEGPLPPVDNTRTFADTFDWYMSQFGSRVWPAPHGATLGNVTLDLVRGKIIILDDFSGGAHGIDWNAAQIQDNYNLATNWHLADKWRDVKAQLQAADTTADSPAGNITTYVNFLSGSGGSFPYFVASGHSSPQTGAPRLLTGWTDGVIDTCKQYRRCIDEYPRVGCFAGTCSVAFEGTNILTMDYLNNGSVTKRAGIVMADFPGAGLLRSIINLNGLHFLAPTPSAGAGNPNGGIPATALCPRDAVLTGLTLHMNGSAGSVTGTCRPLLFSGPDVSMVFSSSELPTIGHTGTRDATTTCPYGSVVTGFTGRSGLLVDGVQLVCAQLNANGSLGTESETAYVGGTGGSPFPRKTCSGMAVGLFGRSGNDLDYLALECASLTR
jgi:1-phosphatidylinositol phosphodiesterase